VECQEADCTTGEGVRIRYRMERTYEEHMGELNPNITNTSTETLTATLPEGLASFERLELSRSTYHWEEYGLGYADSVHSEASWVGRVDLTLPESSWVESYTSEGADGGMGNSERADFSSERCDITWTHDGFQGEHHFCVADDCTTIDEWTSTIEDPCNQLDPDTWEIVGPCVEA